MSKDLTNKINNMDKLSQSQLDRLNMNLKVQDNLFSFLDSQIQKVISENSIKHQLLTDIKQRIEEEGFNNIPWVVVIKLLEIYSKEENEISITLLNMIKDVQIKNLESNNIDTLIENMEKNTGDSEFTKEDVKKFKNLHDFLKSVKDSELPEEK